MACARIQSREVASSCLLSVRGAEGLARFCAVFGVVSKKHDGARVLVSWGVFFVVVPIDIITLAEAGRFWSCCSTSQHYYWERSVCVRSATTFGPACVFSLLSCSMTSGLADMFPFVSSIRSHFPIFFTCPPLSFDEVRCVVCPTEYSET